MSKDDITSRVKRGAARFDSQKSDWWSLENVNVESLDQSHPRFDVIGQNRKNEPGWDGRFDYTVLELESIQQAAQEGFYFTVDECGFSRADWDTVEENKRLTDAWKKEIEARRKRA